ncbi:MAG: helix-turn-helix domain-containing protein, partial [Bacteroidota bacterium]
PYLRSDLKLADLARILESTPHELSQVLNDRLGQRFTDYLRGFRVHHAQQSILTDDHLTLEAIGLEAGFGSKSAFYAAFREVTGTTPATYRKERTKIPPDL